MNIINAIKSGKNIRRPSYDEYCYVPHAVNDRVCLTKEELLAEDWEIEEQKIELSWEQIHKAMREYFCIPPYVNGEIKSMVKLKKDLGFE